MCLRDAFWGAAVVPGLGTVRLAADSVHVSSIPEHLLTLQVIAAHSCLAQAGAWQAGRLRRASEAGECVSAPLLLTSISRRDDVQGQLAMFADQLAADDPLSASSCREAASRGGEPASVVCGSSYVPRDLRLSACFTYRLASPEEEADLADASRTSSMVGRLEVAGYLERMDEDYRPQRGVWVGDWT